MLRLRMDAHNAGLITPAVSTFVSKFFLVKDALGRSACGKRAKIKELPSVYSDEVGNFLERWLWNGADVRTRLILLLAARMN